MRIIPLALTLWLAWLPAVSYGIIVYGQSNESAAVSYDEASNAAQCSVVSVAGASAVYLGNGWFITANHVGATLSSAVRQNGASTSVSFVDSTLAETYGVDFKLFYVEDVSPLTSLASAELSTDIYSSLENTSFSYSRTGNIFSGYTYNLVYTEGTPLVLVGAGYGRSSGSALDAATVSSNFTTGTVHWGQTALYTLTALQGTDVLVTMAETVDGSAQAQTGDSGGGMFIEKDGVWYLAGLMTNVSPETSASQAVFGSYADAQLTYGANGVPNGVDTSPLLDNSFTIALNLEDYIGEILATIATVPIPEPSQSAWIFGILAVGCGVWRRKRR